MPSKVEQNNLAYLDKIGDEYWAKFGHCIGIPFGKSDFTDDDLMCEYEIALGWEHPEALQEIASIITFSLVS